MDQGFHLRPNFGIALDLGVSLHEKTVVPGVLLAVERIPFVIGAEISDDMRARRIGSADLGFAVQKAVQLIEICGLGYVRGNDLIILAGLGDTVHLNGEQNRNTLSSQFSRQRNGFRSAPAVSVQDDAGALLFFGR